MKTIFLSLCFSAALFAQAKTEPAKPPVLTAEQKFEIRDAQVAFANLDAQKAKLESRYKDVQAAIEKATAVLNAAVKKNTPAGFVLQNDLSLVAKPKPADAKK